MARRVSKTGGVFHGKATKITRKQKENFPAGVTSYLKKKIIKKKIFKLGIKVSVAAWWIILQQNIPDGKISLGSRAVRHSPGGMCRGGAADAPGGAAAPPPMPTLAPRCCFHLEEAGQARR